MPPSQLATTSCPSCLPGGMVCGSATFSTICIVPSFNTCLQCSYHGSGTSRPADSNLAPHSVSSHQRLAKLGLGLPEIRHLSPDELDLLTAWCTTTSRSLAQNQGSRDVWRSVISREALKCPTLLHSILGLSALHLACYNTQDYFRRRLLSAAQMYWNRAHVGLMEETSSSLNNTSCVSLFAQCNTQLIFSFAYSQLVQSSTSTSAVDRLCDLLWQTRAPNTSLIDLVEASQYGDLSSLVAPQHSGPNMPHTATLAILGLKRLSSDLRNRHTREIYDETIDHLNSCLAYTKSSSDPGLSGLYWILRVPSAYLDLLPSREPLALIILAHYCVVLFHLRDRWWMGNWGTVVLQEIASSLGRDRLASIDWAIDSTGICIGGV